MPVKGSKKKRSIWTPIGGWPLFGVLAVGILGLSVYQARQQQQAEGLAEMERRTRNLTGARMDGGMLSRILEAARW